ncbi:hypothetical protein GCM10009853_021300 [Glycomyces scopariae]
MTGTPTVPAPRAAQAVPTDPSEAPSPGERAATPCSLKAARDA